jgi:hypothetical protein
MIQKAEAERGDHSARHQVNVILDVSQNQKLLAPPEVRLVPFCAAPVDNRAAAELNLAEK